MARKTTPSEKQRENGRRRNGTFAPGNRAGKGRPKGTPNRRTVEARELIERTLGSSPLEKMARLAKELLAGEHRLSKQMLVDGKVERIHDRGFELKLATNLLTELAAYCAPKRKAVEHSMDKGDLGTLVDLVRAAR